MTPTPRPTLAVGPANYAGQATQWARAVTRELGVDAWSFSRTQGFDFPVDRRLPPRGPVLSRRAAATSPRVHAAWAGATHVALDGFLALSGGQVAGSLTRDVHELHRHGVQLALVAHGSDLRNPLTHAARVRHSWFRSMEARYLTTTLAAVARNRAVLSSLGLPLFVSTPDLLNDVPRAVWLPLVVDSEPWRGASEPLRRRVPRVLHRPSRRRPAIKGTDAIAAVGRRLATEGLCEYVEPEPMPHADFVEVVKDADIVIDQIQSDAYGATAVEAMAAGRLVVASVLGSRDLVPDDIPIVDATPATLEPVLRALLTDRDRSASLAAHGPAYVSRWHDGRAAAEALRPFLGL